MKTVGNLYVKNYGDKILIKALRQEKGDGGKETHWRVITYGKSVPQLGGEEARQRDKAYSEHEIKH